ncbi:MAG: hypothetical protein IPJ65_29765 [Archangiaceae bacterium]|nr:hypothetical protein [Archangiaceae bacterium]
MDSTVSKHVSRYTTVMHGELDAEQTLLEVATKDNLGLDAPSLFIAVPKDVFDAAVAATPLRKAYGEVLINTDRLGPMKPETVARLGMFSRSPADEFRELVGTTSDLGFVASEPPVQ